MYFLTSCGFFSTKNNLQYSTLKSFSFKTTTKEDVIRQLGQPNEILVDGNRQTLHYNDKANSHQRASIYISSATNLLDSYLWIPPLDEKESKFDGAISNFGKTSFEELPDIYSLPHFISSTVRVKDKKNGISIMYNRHTKAVDAIGFSGSKERSTSFQ